MMAVEQTAAILIIDDEEIIREALEALLWGKAIPWPKRRPPRKGWTLLGSRSVDAVLLDLMLPDKNGLEVLEDIRRIDDQMPVIMITAFGTIEGAVAATKQGRLLLLHQALQERRGARRAAERDRASPTRPREQGTSRPAPLGTHRFDENHRRQSEDSRGLRLDRPGRSKPRHGADPGESGTGKDSSPMRFTGNRRAPTRRSSPSTPAICRPTCRVQSLRSCEGRVHRRRASKKGLFEVADKARSFSTKSPHPAPDTQAKLLRVIQEREFMRLGRRGHHQGRRPHHRGVQCGIAATWFASGRFREDLYHRLNVILVPLPPLRDRKDDIPILVQHFLEKYLEESRKRAMVVTPAAIDRLMAYRLAG